MDLINVILGIFSFLLGTTIGSFLNVVIYRYNTGMGVNGRSQCFSCGKQLQWYELIPVLSFLFLRGKCSQCQSRISWQYPLVELMTGLTFLALFLRYYSDLVFSQANLLYFVFALIVACIFIVILVYDIRHKIIPDGLVFVLGLLSVVSLFVSSDFAFRAPSVSALLTGPLLAAPFALLWLVSGGRWMGLGDAKLALPMGWFLGISGGLSAIIIAFWIGAFVGILLMVIEKLRSSFIHRVLLSLQLGTITMKSEIPFAPFLIFGFMIVFLLGIDVLHLNVLFGI